MTIGYLLESLYSENPVFIKAETNAIGDEIYVYFSENMNDTSIHVSDFNILCNDTLIDISDALLSS